MQAKTRRYVGWIVLVSLVGASNAQALEYPGVVPGPARLVLQDDTVEAGNRVLLASWRISETGLQAGSFRDAQQVASMDLTGELFQIRTADGIVYGASRLQALGTPVVSERVAQPANACLAQRTAGQQVEVPMQTDDGRLRMVWRAILLDDANYLRQELELTTVDKPVTIQEITWLNQPIPGAKSAGSVDGSLVVVGTFFAGVEDPMAENRVVNQNDSRAEANPTVCRLQRQAELLPGEVLTVSFVVGVAPAGQLRRAFLYYLEQERAHPYRPFLHYNSWYDIAWTPFALNEQNCLEAIRLFGERLIQRHDVVLDALVFDDGWDDPQSLWKFHSGFPQGFTPLAELSKRYGTHLGVWLSPFGGYGEPRENRLAYGRQQGYETNETGFSLAGPRYYQAFKQACVTMIRQYGVNHFKFDGIATGMSAQGAGDYVRDTEAMRRLMLELRQVDPHLYINLTTGSWPSPFWLRYADSVWRQGHDMGFAGPGSKQQQWLTYRDQEIYRNIVCRGPLYPLNSLMTQGVAYSRQGYAGDPTFDSAGFKEDVRAFFGSGTGLQELYIQPGRLTDDDWAVLAESARWSRANADVLVDTHWIGGDPSQLQVYGFASWAPRKGILMLRNPDVRPQEYALDVGQAFELPIGAAVTYSLASPWAEDSGRAPQRATAGTPLPIHLQPLEVRILQATPLPLK